jgi:general secretion pathway protein G
MPRAGGFGAGRGDINVNATDVGNSELSTKKKVYLRAIPVNPFTGERDWETRSCYDEPGATSTGGENVFDVIFPPDKDRSFIPLKEGEKYSDW